MYRNMNVPMRRSGDLSRLWDFGPRPVPVVNQKVSVTSVLNVFGVNCALCLGFICKCASARVMFL